MTGTGADLRRLSLKNAKQLRKFGVPEEEVGMEEKNLEAPWALCRGSWEADIKNYLGNFVVVFMVD